MRGAARASSMEELTAELPMFALTLHRNLRPARAPAAASRRQCLRRLYRA